MTIAETARRLRARKISAVELAQESLRRIRTEQPRINAFITITEDLASEQARRADEELSRGLDRGPLHGIPYALKDLFHVSGVRTTAGSKIFADRVSTRDCAVYERLRDAGAVLMGKTGMHELAYGVTNDNPHFGPVRNPHDSARVSGGSSGGSAAAVAAGLVHFALGTDTGGSIRIPAAYCGCVGFKPTFARVNTDGVMPLAFSLDHVGPLAPTPEDAALVMNAIAEDWIPESVALEGLRIGIPENFYSERVMPEVAGAFSDALDRARKAGAHLHPIRVPDPSDLNVLSRVILLCEASAIYEPYASRRTDFGPDVLALLDQGRMLAATDYINAQRLRRICQTEWNTLFDKVDCIFMPSTPLIAPVRGESQVAWVGDKTKEDVRLAISRFARGFNVLGLPAVSIPLPVNGLPIGLQIVGRLSYDACLLSVAATLFRM